MAASLPVNPNSANNHGHSLGPPPPPAVSSLPVNSNPTNEHKHRSGPGPDIAATNSTTNTSNHFRSGPDPDKVFEMILACGLGGTAETRALARIVELVGTRLCMGYVSKDMLPILSKQMDFVSRAAFGDRDPRPNADNMNGVLSIEKTAPGVPEGQADNGKAKDVPQGLSDSVSSSDDLQLSSQLVTVSLADSSASATTCRTHSRGDAETASESRLLREQLQEEQALRLRDSEMAQAKLIETQTQLSTERQALTLEKQTLQEEIENHLRNLVEVKSQLEAETARRIDDKSKHNVEASRLNAEHSAKNEIVIGQVKTLSDELSAARNQIATLSNQVTRLEVDNDKETVLRGKAEQELKTARSTIEEMRSAVARLESEQRKSLEEVKTELEMKAQDTTDRLESEHQQACARIRSELETRAKSERDKAETEIAALRRSLDQAKSEMDKTKSELTDFHLDERGRLCSEWAAQKMSVETELTKQYYEAVASLNEAHKSERTRLENEIKRLEAQCYSLLSYPGRKGGNVDEGIPANAAGAALLAAKSDADKESEKVFDTPPQVRPLNSTPVEPTPTGSASGTSKKRHRKRKHPSPQVVPQRQDSNAHGRANTSAQESSPQEVPMKESAMNNSIDVVLKTGPLPNPRKRHRPDFSTSGSRNQRPPPRRQRGPSPIVPRKMTMEHENGPQECRDEERPTQSEHLSQHNGWGEDLAEDVAMQPRHGGGSGGGLEESPEDENRLKNEQESADGVLKESLEDANRLRYGSEDAGGEQENRPDDENRQKYGLQGAGFELQVACGEIRESVDNESRPISGSEVPCSGMKVGAEEETKSGADIAGKREIRTEKPEEDAMSMGGKRLDDVSQGGSCDYQKGKKDDDCPSGNVKSKGAEESVGQDPTPGKTATQKLTLGPVPGDLGTIDPVRGGKESGNFWVQSSAVKPPTPIAMISLEEAVVGATRSDVVNEKISVKQETRGDIGKEDVKAGMAGRTQEQRNEKQADQGKKVVKLRINFDDYSHLFPPGYTIADGKFYVPSKGKCGASISSRIHGDKKGFLVHMLQNEKEHGEKLTELWGSMGCSVSKWVENNKEEIFNGNLPSRYKKTTSGAPSSQSEAGAPPTTQKNQEPALGSDYQPKADLSRAGLKMKDSGSSRCASRQPSQQPDADARFEDNPPKRKAGKDKTLSAK